MLILISMGTLVMELDLIEDQVFSFSGGRFGQNVLIFGVDMSFPAYIDSSMYNCWLATIVV